jgi:hypothetical protein
MCITIQLLQYKQKKHTIVEVSGFYKIATIKNNVYFLFKL